MFYVIYSTAAYNGHTAVCKLLINKGSNVNASNKDVDTPLHGGKY